MAEIERQRLAREQRPTGRRQPPMMNVGEGFAIEVNDEPATSTDPFAGLSAEKNETRRRSIERITEALIPNSQRLREARAELALLTVAQRAEIDAGLALGQSIEEATDGLGLGEAAQKLYASSVRESAKATKEGAKELGELQKLADQFSGADLAAKVDLITKAFHLAEKQGGVTGAQMKVFEKQLFDLWKAGAPIPKEFEAIVEEQIALDFQTKLNAKSTASLVKGLTGLGVEAKIAAPAISKAEIAQEQFNQTLSEGLINVEEMNAETKKAPANLAAWRSALSSIASNFEQLANIAGDSMSEVARAMGTGFQAGTMLNQSLGAMRLALTGSNKDWKIFAANAMQAAVAIAQAGQSLMAATDTLSTKKNVLSGAATGAQIGMGLAGPYGAAAGFIVGAIVGAFRNKDAQRAFKEVGKDTGVTITEATAKAMQETGNKIFGGGQGGRWAAEVFHLGDIIKDAGGVTAKNFSGIAKQFQQGLNFLKEGTFTVEQFATMANSAFPALAQHAAKMGGVWTKEFSNIVSQIKSTGIEVEGFAELIDGQFNKIASATGAITSGVIATSDEFDRLNRITLAAFNAYIAQGHSAAEAAAFFGSSIDALISKQKEFGFTTGAAFDELSRMRGLVSENQPLLDQIGGLNELMAALSNVGGLTAQAFTDIATQGQSAFDKLIQAGFTEREALAQLAPMLATINALRDRGEIAIDDQTAALIEQARKAGLLKEQVTEAQALETGFNKVESAVDRLGATLVDIFANRVPNAMAETEAAADRIGRSLGGMHVPSFGGGGGGGGGGGDASESRPFFRQPSFAMVGAAGVGAMRMSSPLAADFGGTTTIILERDGRRDAEFVVPHIPGVMRRLRI